MMRAAAVVLAAGASRRFGSPKQLVRREGATLVRRAAQAAAASGFRPVVIVLGSSAAEIAPELAGFSVDVVVNAEWEEGIASSIRAGVRRLRDVEPEVEAAVLLLADQPEVSEALLRALAERLERGPETAVACRYAGVLGPPAILAASLFSRLEGLTGDQGARSLLRSGAIPVAAIDFPGGARDVDEPGDI